MPKLPQALPQLLLACLLVFLSACSPQYNWREVHGNTVPFTVLLPGKADTFTQSVELNGAQVPMTMTATDVNGVTFAVGTASFADAAAAQSGMNQMKEALIKNINGSTVNSAIPGTEIAGGLSLTLSAVGTDRGKPLKMIGHLYNIEKRVYQVIMVGDPKKMPDDASEMFFTSFKAN
ncbi:MAG TPA: hypothetical protein VGM52_00355 [Herbaspirillum sp.]|jgi:hypothetical protein